MCMYVCVCIYIYIYIYIYTHKAPVGPRGQLDEAAVHLELAQVLLSA